MKKTITAREIILLAALAVLLVGVAYYMFFYKPLQSELASVQNQCADLDTQLTTVSAKVSRMNAMQEELDAIHALPAGEVTEIAPYDNSNVIMAELNGILSKSGEYKLNFSDPSTGDDGIVRRPVSMVFRCRSFRDACNILGKLNSCHWRSLMTSLSINGEEDDLRSGYVQVNTSITYFESKNFD